VTPATLYPDIAPEIAVNPSPAGYGEWTLNTRAAETGARPPHGVLDLASSDAGEQGDGFGEIIGSSPALLRVLDEVRMVAPTGSTVLIEGETGTGKELIARAIHLNSPRCAGPFVRLNCAAIPGELLESELFGHERGAFTGAFTQRLGRFETADGGTLFLDEVGDFPLELQPKLLRVLQDQEFERLGSNRTRSVNVRVVAATNQDLAELVARKQFRMDLYYRLNVFPIELPPLRERAGDIPALVGYFVRKYNERMSKEISAISAEAMEMLKRYPWPGNIRQLQNYVERAMILTHGHVLALPPLPACAPVQEEPRTLANAERTHILKALEQSKWVIGGKCGAAARLGVKRTTLIDKMRRCGVSRPLAQSAFAS